MSATVQQIGVFVLAAIALVAVAVLSIISHPIPSILSNITYVLVGSAAGVALPSATAPKAPVA